VGGGEWFVAGSRVGEKREEDEGKVGEKSEEEEEDHAAAAPCVKR
jgi:hypothetical protein